jgi:pimeloyl-ACP methyl ester carboxylesterase
MARMYPRRTPDDVLVELLSAYRRYAAWRGVVRSLRGLNPYHVLRWRSHMRHLELPTLILWGTVDPYFPATVPERLHRDLPQSLLQYVPDAGHFLMLSRPEETAEALTRFVHTTGNRSL